jgi:hypothetical protein
MITMSHVLTTPQTGAFDAPASSVTRRVPFVVREVLLLALGFVGYRQIRYLTRNDTQQAVDNAGQVIDVERAWHLFHEPWVQTQALRSETVVSVLNHYYVSVHFPLTALFVAWVLVRHHEWYRSIRNWMLGVTGAALLIHVAYPLAPPRMVRGEGFVDTLRVYGPNIYPEDTTQSVANQFAAMPSLHFGWSVIVAVGFIAIVRRRWSWIALAHPVITLLAIVATANHYWLDAIVAGVLVAVGGALVATSRRAGRDRTPAPAPASLPLALPVAVPSSVPGIDPDVEPEHADLQRRHLAASVHRHPSAVRCTKHPPTHQLVRPGERVGAGHR